jgi:hypothetical protein
VAEYLLISKCEALRLNPSTAKGGKKKIKTIENKDRSVAC